MTTYIRKVKSLEIVVHHGRCTYVNYNPQEIKIITHENIDQPILNVITIVANGVNNDFKLHSKFIKDEWERVNPSMMIYKGL